MLTLNEAKQHLRITWEDENIDNEIILLINASVKYIQNETSDTVDTTSNLFELAQRMLVAHWYYNKEIIGQASLIKHSLDSILLQLKYCD